MGIFRSDDIPGYGALCVDGETLLHEFRKVTIRTVMTERSPFDALETISSNIY